jgi:hydrogenase maturation protease
MHGDDRAGWSIIDHLARDPIPEIELRRAAAPVDLLDWLEGVERMIVCDACSNCGAPGRVHHWRWPDAEIARVCGANTHDVSLAAVLGLAERLGRLPATVLIWAIEVAQCEPNAALSPEVSAALPEMALQLKRELLRPAAEARRVQPSVGRG